LDSSAVLRVALQVRAADLALITLHVGAIIGNALAVYAHLAVSAAGSTAVFGHAFAVGAFFSRRTNYPHAVGADALIVVAHLKGLADLAPAGFGEAFAPGAALARRAVNADAIDLDTLVVVAYLAEVRALDARAVFRVAPAVGAHRPGLALDVHTGATLANSVDAHLALAETAHVGAVVGIAEPTGAALPGVALNPYATALNTLIVDAHLAVARTGLGGAVGGIALPGRAGLSRLTLAQIVDAGGSLRAVSVGDTDATGRMTFFVDAHLAHSGAVSRLAAPGEAGAMSAGLVHRAFHAQAGNLHAQIVFTDEILGTRPSGTIPRPAESVNQVSVGAVFEIDPGIACGHESGQKDRQGTKPSSG
jgi:hypothetical protein